VKALALAEHDGGPYIPFTLETVTDRTYPLTRSIYAYVNMTPGKPLDPKVREFLRFILSREGQDSVTQQQVFLPLPSATAIDQLKKLK